jgi:hypothetical protein
VDGWVQVCGVALGLLAMLAAFKLPVPVASPAPASELGALTPRAAPAPEPPGDALAPGAAVTTAEPQPERAEPLSQTLMLRPSEPSAGAVARPTPDPGALHSVVSSASPAPAEPHQPSAEPAAQRAPGSMGQSSAGPVVPARRANVVTVDDMFGIGGDEPLPPEALEGPTPAVPPPAGGRKPTRPAPAAPASLFYQELPF